MYGLSHHANDTLTLNSFIDQPISQLNPPPSSAHQQQAVQSCGARDQFEDVWHIE